MKPLTLEWIEKAEGDFISAQREFRAKKFPNYDAACFHSQQCAEKYLKARLQEAGIPFGKTHDLAVLLDSLLQVEPLWDSFRSQLRILTAFAIEFRYPGQSADKEMARQAISICKSIRSTVRIGFGLMT
jgi:HEPN domain-containing protein